MYLVQLLLPLYDNEARPLPRAHFTEVAEELTGRFGGVTAYLRSPARGVWRDEEGDVARDDIVIHEVMVESLDRDWWAGYRERLRARFTQQELVIRAHAMERL